MTFLKAYLYPGKDQFYQSKNDTKKNHSNPNSKQEKNSKNIETVSSIDNNNVHKRCLNLSAERNLVDDYLFDIPRDPFISPLYASDEMLKQLPPVKFVVRPFVFAMI